jgi:hypothetical protein
MSDQEGIPKQNADYDLGIVQKVSGQLGGAGNPDSLLPGIMVVTHNDENAPHHLLSSDQFQKLTDLSSDKSADRTFDWFLGLGAAALGFVQNFWIVACALIYGTKEPVSRLDIMLALIFIVLLTGAIIMWLQQKNKKQKLDDYIEELKSRPTKTIK